MKWQDNSIIKPVGEFKDHSTQKIQIKDLNPDTKIRVRGDVLTFKNAKHLLGEQYNRDFTDLEVSQYLSEMNAEWS